MPSYPSGRITITPSDASILPTLLRLLDTAITQLSAQGRANQWGSAARALDEEFTVRVKAILLTSRVLRALSRSGSTLGVIAFSNERPHPELIPPPDGGARELYVQLLVTDQADDEARGVGRMLVERAVEVARADGVGVLRVDCFGGGDRKLVSVYERMGFVRKPERPLLRGRERWPMQVLEMRI